MAPIHSGLTLTAAEGESRRCLPRRDFGGGAGSIIVLRYSTRRIIYNQRQQKCESEVENIDIELFKYRLTYTPF